ncbi:MerR family transcriptional regulator [Bacillus methanolicus]|uniref:MerR family transcriptional regulator n=1 Tax=Bacillus methanolicus TaxID=1471 RepID=UPI002380C286|nr:MerR family transcriptional regulator [Bacillus methanolicus]MDE3837996.1 MerR family transcriptional regulator [Bacillus methanolicus]MDE3840748.1 MerR family transcriptional regulator [Bacillus methanolicus]
MGELAELANVTKRTIDYYTNLGLLKAERTASNYRYYSQEALEDLRFIEACKKQQLTLQEIKEALVRRKQGKQTDIVNQANDIANQIHHLKEKIEDLLPLIENLNEKERKHITKRLSPESITLIQTLLMLLG